MRTIKLHGRLKEIYPDEIRLDVSSVGETIRALSFQIPRFKEAISTGHYQVFLDKDDPENTITTDLIRFNLGACECIHIKPVLEGAKGGGGGKIIAGIALVALSFAIPGAVGALGPQIPGLFGANIVTSSLVAKLGIGLALTGVSQLLTPQLDAPSSSSFERPEERPSFLFNGPVNTTEQGGPVPLVYGTFRVGSTVVSAGLSVEKI